MVDPLASADLQGFAATSSGSDALARLNAAATLINGFTDSDDSNAQLMSMVGANGLVGCLTELASGLTTAQYIGGYGDSAFGTYLLDLLSSPINEFKSTVDALFVPGGNPPPDDYDYWNSANLQQLSKSFLNPFTTLWMGQFNVLSASLDEFIRGTFWDPSTEDTGNRSVVQQTVDQVSLAIHQLFLDGDKVVGNLGGMLLFAMTEGIPAIEAELTYIRQLKAAMKSLLQQSCQLPPSMMPGLPNAIITEHLCIALRELEIVRNDLAQRNVLDVDHFNTATAEVCLAKDSILDPSKGLNGNISNQFKNLFGLNDVQFNTLKQFAKGNGGALMPNPQFRLLTILVQRYNNMIQSTDVQLLQFHENMQEFNKTINGFSAIYLGDVFSRIVELLRRQIQMIKTQLEADAAGFSVQSDIENIDELRGFGSSRAEWDYANNWGPGTGSAGLPPNKPYDRTYQQARTDQQQKGVPNAGAAEMDDAFNRSRNWQPADPKNPDYNAKVPGLTQTPRVQEQTGHRVVATDVQQQGSDIYSYVSTQANAYVILLSLCFVMGRMQKLYKGVQGLLNADNRIIDALRKFTYGYGINVCGDPYGADDINTNVRNFLAVAEMRLGGRVRTTQPIQAAYAGVIQACDKQEKYLLCMRGQMNIFLANIGLNTQIVAGAMNVASLARTVPQLASALAGLQYTSLYKSRWTLDRVNVLDVILKALQCLLLQCTNPFLSSLARLAMNRFSADRDNERSKGITMASMDQCASVAQTTGNNARLQALFALIQSLQRLTSMNINDLCAIPLRQTTAPGSTATVASTTRPNNTSPTGTGIDTQYDQLQLESQQQQAAAGAQQPFATAATSLA